MNFEETKKKYEGEIARLQTLAQALQKQYQAKFTEIKKVEEDLINEYNTEIQKITIGIERLRGAYTALCDAEDGKEPSLVENGMMKDVVIPEEQNETTFEEGKGKVEEVLQETKAGIEKAVEDVKQKEEKISNEIKQKASKLVKEAKDNGKVTSYEEFANSDLGKETALSAEEIEALKAVTEATNEDTPNENTSKNEANNVKPEEVPDYLKDQYGLK